MIEERTCDCGAVYGVTRLRTPGYEEGGFDCVVCGDHLASWSGITTMHFRYLEGGTDHALVEPTDGGVPPGEVSRPSPQRPPFVRYAKRRPDSLGGRSRW